MNCKLAALALATALAVSPLYAQAPESLSAETLPLMLSQSLMLDFVDSGNRAIAVGERGHIAVSESRGDWRQVADVPTRSTLTAVAAVGDRAWAVGHDGIILGSEDGGLTWAVQRIDTWSPPAADDFDAEFNPTQGAPLLDVLALDRDRVIAIGAYSLMLVSADGGKSWQQVDPNASAGAVDAGDESAVDGVDAEAVDGAEAEAEADDWTMSDESLVLEDEEDPHLNGIARTPEGGLMVVGERGSAYRSLDDGASWQRLRLPYDGSMFGVLALGERHVLAFGLRGNVQESRDLGDSWETPDSGTELSLQGGAVLPGGAGVLLVGSNGVLLKRAQGAAGFTLQTFANERQETPVLSAALPLSATDVIVAGEKGIGRTSLK
ncbi:WD40/YVTN/BNR-like repeat-containing protein [Aquimonas sp.]|jgi:photosystem II stability/assembly factor-like uncharacterized protein|uniref:WD40/YVTN/BNR-like repeat-containing protein n=1 Tax=Aquimonas sp. TaxID=1872588 RepID=UPI0037C0A1C9